MSHARSAAVVTWAYVAMFGIARIVLVHLAWPSLIGWHRPTQATR